MVGLTLQLDVPDYSCGARFSRLETANLRVGMACWRLTNMATGASMHERRVVISAVIIQPNRFSHYGMGCEFLINPFHPSRVLWFAS